MCSIPPLGAINKRIKEYTYPYIANKSDDFICPDCGKDLTLRKGDIRVHHFAHRKDDNPCTYYDKPTESHIHKDAKMLMKSILDNKKPIELFRKCCGQCGHEDKYEIPEITDTSKIVIEHRFTYNNGLKIADVAYLDNNEIVCIFEMCNTNKTNEGDRPEPWFEIDALTLINLVNHNRPLKIECIRKERCDDCTLQKCIRCDELCEKRAMNTNRIDKQCCKTCDIELYSQIMLEVPFSDKDKIKNMGGRFEKIYKKWYITDRNINKKLILSKWKVWKPTSTIQA